MLPTFLGFHLFCCIELVLQNKCLVCFAHGDEMILIFNHKFNVFMTRYILYSMYFISLTIQLCFFKKKLFINFLKTGSSAATVRPDPASVYVIDLDALHCT